MTRRIAVLGLFAALGVLGCGRKDTAPPATQSDDTPNPRPPAGAPVDLVTAGEFKKFEGTWVVVGAKFDDDTLENQLGIEYTFAAGKLTQRNSEGVLDTARVVLKPNARPKAVDLISDHLREGESPALFIYEFDGDALRLCRGDATRPTAFTGKELLVLTLKRKKG